MQVAEALAQKYDVVVTNPPYMGSSGMSANLSGFVKKNYPDSKSDLFAVFIEKCGQMAKKNGYQAMITQHAWMFISSFQNLREKVYERKFVSIIHLGIKAFEEIGNDVVQTCAFVVQGKMIEKFISKCVRLVDCKNYFEKEQEYLVGHYQFASKVSEFEKIPGMPFAYWVGPQFISNFNDANFIENYGILTGSQNITGDNEKYLRCCWEVLGSSIGSRWHFYAKGGDYRQYYGNLSFVVDWSDAARNFYSTNKTSNLLGKEYWFKPGITYSAITSRGTGFRYLPEGCIFDKGGPSINLKSDIPEILALLNTNVAKYYFWVFNPSINLQVKDVKNFPIILSHDENVIEMAKINLNYCKEDWDSQETSWEFQRHPLLRGVTTIDESFKQWERECEVRFDQLKKNEEELNRIFINIYGLDNEVSSEVEDRDVTVRKADLGRDIRSFISYAVGCMFGRYSLDEEGLAFAGGEWDDSKYASFLADEDNIIPICDDEYFADDIVGRFVEFVKTVYGADTLEENLQFIADALGGNGHPKDVIRNYFRNDFYADHCKIYQKRPIYWLFDSGKKGGFRALIYMHRYQPDTIARMRTDYVHEQQSRYRTAIADLEQRIESASTSERVKLNRRLKTLNEQAAEIQGYEEKIHHLADQYISIDLDDGVKKNYEIFKDVLAKIK